MRVCAKKTKNEKDYIAYHIYFHTVFNAIVVIFLMTFFMNNSTSIVMDD